MCVALLPWSLENQVRERRGSWHSCAFFWLSQETYPGNPYVLFLPQNFNSQLHHQSKTERTPLGKFGLMHENKMAEKILNLRLLERVAYLLNFQSPTYLGLCQNFFFTYEYIKKYFLFPKIPVSRQMPISFSVITENA